MNSAAPPRRITRRFVLVSVAALLAFALALALGRWQLSRAAEKTGLQRAIERQQQLPPLVAAQLLAWPRAAAPPADALHRRVSLRGRWLAADTVFLDNRQMQGRPGFFVLTPLRLEGSEQAILVQRGWVARNFLERERLPELPTPAHAVQLVGRLAAAPPALFELGSSPAPGTAGRIRQNLDLQAFAAQIGQPLLPATVLELAHAANVGDGLQRDWLQVASGSAKHDGYAAQWFALALLIALLYGWFQWPGPRWRHKSGVPRHPTAKDDGGV